MENFFSTLWTLMDLVFCYFFLGSFLQPSKSLRQKLGTILVAWLIGSAYTILISNQMLKQILSLFLLYFVSSYLYKGSWYLRMLYITLGYILSGIVDILSVYGVSALLGISYSQFVWRKFYYVVTVSAGKLLAILLAWIMRKLRKPGYFHTSQRNWLLLTLLFPSVSLAMLAVVFNGFQYAQDLSVGAVVFSVFLSLANIAIIYLLGVMERNALEMRENALLHQQMEIQTESILALEKNYRNQRQTIHDHRNQIQTIYDLLTFGNTPAAMDYIQKLQGMQTTRIFTINAHHPIVDAILNHKYQVAQEHGIDFQVQVNDLSRASLETHALVVLFSNLIDNAIEGCCRLSGDRIIQCSIIANDGLFISVRNTSPPVVISGNTIPTSKSPKEEHGFGLQRIQLILKQLQAEYSFSYENGWFNFAAEIPSAVTQPE